MFKVVIVPGDAELIKFVLTEDETVYVGRVEHHRDLGAPESLMIVGAGIVPLNPERFMDLGGTMRWKSVAYEVVTPQALRPQLRELFVGLSLLWNPTHTS